MTTQQQDIPAPPKPKQTPFERFLALPGVQHAKPYSRGYRMLCPVHHDTEESLMFWEDESDGHIGIVCWPNATQAVMRCKVAKGKSGATSKRSSNKHALSALPFPPGCLSQKWTPSEEKRWIKNLTKHVFGDGAFFRACYFALHDSLRSIGPQ